MKNQFISLLVLSLVPLVSCSNPSADASRSTDVVVNNNTTGGSPAQVEPQNKSAAGKPLKVEIDGKPTEVLPAKEIVPELAEDMKYATSDNFMKRRMYTDATCYLLEDTARKLALAQAELSRRNPGFRLKVWDCYRPMAIQQEMWKEYTNTPYVANPKTARHPRGRAVDITIVDASGNELEMPTAYDDFSPKAHPNAPTTPKRAANRELLRSVMTSVGFTGVNSEWWHFDNLSGSEKQRR